MFSFLPNCCCALNLLCTNSAQALLSLMDDASVLLREHLRDKNREGSLVAEGNQFHRNRGCELANCNGHRSALGDTTSTVIGARSLELGKGDIEPLSGVVEVDNGVGGRYCVDGLSGESISSDRTGQASQVCVPTAEEEGLPLPATVTMRFLAAMDEGYIGSILEESSRARRASQGMTR